jgi:hypothetical protein
MKISVTPYTRVDGVPTFTNSEVMNLYDRAVLDGVDSMLFLDGTIQSRTDWLASVTSGHSLLCVISLDGEFAGIGWLDRMEGHSAYVGFWVFDRFRGSESVFIAQDFQKYVFNLTKSVDSYRFDILLFRIPEWNQRAKFFAEKIGCVCVGPIPNFCANYRTGVSEPGYFGYVTREMHDACLQGNPD